MALSPLQELATLAPEVQAKFLASCSEEKLVEMARGEWWWVARPEQRMPLGDWFVWLILSGRGFGKTRTGSEWISSRMLQHPRARDGAPTERGLFAETLSDAMAQCINGPAGIRRVLTRRIGPERKLGRVTDTGAWRLWKAPKPHIEVFAGDLPWQAGQILHIQGADDEDVGRGYNLADAWLDEFAKWPKPDGSWREGIMPSLRQNIPGDFPRTLVTTTPKLVVQLVEWQDRHDGSVHLTTGSTYDNAANLAAPVLAELHRRYHGTRLGRQELAGELIREVEGALWSLDMIEPFRMDHLPCQLAHRVIGFDPAGTGTADESGLVAYALGTDGRDYVLGDWSRRVAGHAACRRAWEMFNAYSADLMLVEKNQGQLYLVEMMHQAYREMQTEGVFPPHGSAPMRIIDAKKAKRLRAEPVAARYEQGRVTHLRGQNLGDLETQMITWVPEDTPESPDRVDALVYGGLYVGGREKLVASTTIPDDPDLRRTQLTPGNPVQNYLQSMTGGTGPYVGGGA